MVTSDLTRKNKKKPEIMYYFIYTLKIIEHCRDTALVKFATKKSTWQNKKVTGVLLKIIKRNNFYLNHNIK